MLFVKNRFAFVTFVLDTWTRFLFDWTRIFRQGRFLFWTWFWCFWRLSWIRSYADWQVLAWVAIYPLFLVTWVEKMTCQVQKRSLSWEGKWPTFVFVLSRLEALDPCSAGHFFNSRDLEQRLNGHSCKNQPIDIWPIPRKTSYKMIFIDFFVDFSDFARTAENPFIELLRD